MRDGPHKHVAPVSNYETFEMQVVKDGRQLLEGDPLEGETKLFHTDDAHNGIPHAGGSRKRLKKQSMDYILRSGIAGGLAGCAVGECVYCTRGYC